jgi:hypothetical protein
MLSMHDQQLIERWQDHGAIFAMTIAVADSAFCH